jgi:hypothetical protein
MRGFHLSGLLDGQAEPITDAAIAERADRTIFRFALLLADEPAA